MIKANGKITKSLESESCFLHLGSCTCTVDTLYEHYMLFLSQDIFDHVM